MDVVGAGLRYFKGRDCRPRGGVRVLRERNYGGGALGL